ncbi:MAG: transketolase [Planctomycetota bacterium]|jgi:transketolase|nr:transketolase [Planctomycetota bacterium]MDR1520122.1 transketolase [Planctomycetota bacterium]
MLSAEKIARYEGKCGQFRIGLIKLLHKIQTGHPGGSLSAVEILTILYNEILRLDPRNPEKPDRDIFILGKGHGAPILYIILADLGFFPGEELASLRQLGSRLQGHPCANKLPGIELSTGPLGLGISAAVGRALAGKLDKTGENVFILLGDGEIQEGIVWEAAMAAGKYRLDNLVAILDHNGVQLDGKVDDIMPLGDVKAKWTAFGWNCLEMDGHNLAEIHERMLQARDLKNGGPVIVIAKTVKGKGVSFMEGNHAWHGKPIGDAEFSAALEELEAK